MKSMEIHKSKKDPCGDVHIYINYLRRKKKEEKILSYIKIRACR